MVLFNKINIVVNPSTFGSCKWSREDGWNVDTKRGPSKCYNQREFDSTPLCCSTRYTQDFIWLKWISNQISAHSLVWFKPISSNKWAEKEHKFGFPYILNRNLTKWLSNMFPCSCQTIIGLQAQSRLNPCRHNGMRLRKIQLECQWSLLFWLVFNAIEVFSLSHFQFYVFV